MLSNDSNQTRLQRADPEVIYPIQIYPFVVYFYQLLGAARPQKLIKLLFSAVFNFFCYIFLFRSTLYQGMRIFEFIICSILF